MKTAEQAAEEYSQKQLGNANQYHREACRIDFLSGAKWAAESGYDRNKLVVYGTDACKECDTGRMTLFAEKHGLCIECYHLKQEGLKR